MTHEVLAMTGSAAVRMASVVAVVVVACNARVGSEARGPSLTFPTRFAEGEDDLEKGADGGSAEDDTPGDAGSDAAPEPPRTGYLPDPEALRIAEQWKYTVRLRGEEVNVESVERVVYPNPIVTGRKMGRWAIELWIGHELVERVRFDFPLAQAETPRRDRRRPLHEPPTFAPGLDVTTFVLVPASPRATRARLLDRATGNTRPLPWPPDQPIDPPSPAKGAPDSGADAAGPPMASPR